MACTRPSPRRSTSASSAASMCRSPTRQRPDSIARSHGRPILKPGGWPCASTPWIRAKGAPPDAVPAGRAPVYVMGYYREPPAPQGAAHLAGPATMTRYFHGVVSSISAGGRTVSLGDRQAATFFLQRSAVSIQGIQQFLGGESVTNVGNRQKLAAILGKLLTRNRSCRSVTQLCWSRRYSLRARPRGAPRSCGILVSPPRVPNNSSPACR